ncbi:membrane protein [Tuber magnatum]|uniref:Membrane protein n=1 Tax=Tuber magnatum TaxID=42249 RepID=A0A317SCB9_9PEZI|nr:membrane protein [Tuber magnatum]
MYASRTSPPPTRSTLSPHIAAPRHGSRSDSGSGSRLPLFFRRMIKFPQMDFEMAIWEMTYLIIAPKKVIRTIYYHVETKNTWSRDDPSFIVLLTFFLTLTSLAWGLAYTPAFASIIRLMFSLIFLHFLLTSVIFASAGYIMCGKFLKVPGTGGLGRAGVVAGEGEMEFMYCLEIGVRAFFPVWVFLYVIQFLMMPILTRDYWISIFLGNSLYLIAFSFYCVITFLGYNALPFLHHTEIMLFPIFVLVVLWMVSLFGFNLTKNIVPILLPVTGRI